MEKSEFDKFAEEYAQMHRSVLGPSGESPEYFAAYKAKDAAREVSRLKLGSGNKLLDFGCGVGGSIRHLSQELPGWQITGVDVSDKSLEIARGLHGDEAEFVGFDGKRLPFTNDTFDVIFTACVFHHIDHDRHLDILTDINRVLAPGGLFIIYEHNPNNWLTVKAVKDCPFDENAVLLPARRCVDVVEKAGFSEPALRYRLFFPSRLGWFRGFERMMTWVPLGAQYYVRAQKPTEHE